MIIALSLSCYSSKEMYGFRALDLQIFLDMSSGDQIWECFILEMC